MKNIFAIRAMSVLPAVVLVATVCDFGVLTAERVSYHPVSVAAVSSTDQSISYDTAAEEQKILRESAKELKVEILAKSTEQQTPVSTPEIAPVISPESPAPEAVDVPPVPEPAPAPIVQAEPVSVAPVQIAEPVQPLYVEPAPAPPAVYAPASRQIYVGLSGGQETVDLCQGPVLFVTAGLPYPYVVEHENCGGWGRIGTLGRGSRVSLSGLVGGEYTVGQIINVNKFATTDALIFASTPRAILQTCIPGTNQMLVYALY